MSEATLAPLSMLWSALGPRPAAVQESPDVGSIAAAAAAQGKAEGRAEAEAELAPLRAALADAATALRAAQAIDAETLQPLFADLVARIAAAVVDAELQAGPAVIDRLVAAALGSIEIEGAATVYFSPADLAGCGPAPNGVAFAADAALAPGHVRIETPRHVVAASLGERLSAMVAAL